MARISRSCAVLQTRSLQRPPFFKPAYLNPLIPYLGKKIFRGSDWSAEKPSIRDFQNASAGSPLGFLYGVCQLATMGFSTQMKGSARNVCTFFNVH